MNLIVNNKEYPHIRVGLEKNEWVELHGELFAYYKNGQLSVQTSLTKLINKHDLKLDNEIINLFKLGYDGKR